MNQLQQYLGCKNKKILEQKNRKNKLEKYDKIKLNILLTLEKTSYPFLKILQQK